MEAVHYDVIYQASFYTGVPRSLYRVHLAHKKQLFIQGYLAHKKQRPPRILQ